MTIFAVEQLPAIWDDATDIPFFRITERMFAPEFCFGASVLLAGYDDDAADAVQLRPAQHRSSTTVPLGVDTGTDPAPGLIPVRVRRTR